LTSLAETHVRHANEQIEHAKQLEESNRYKSEFLANVSHELRTPLNSILLLSKIMRDSGANTLNDEQKQQLRVIHEAGVDLKELIENILDLSRIEAGQASCSYEEIEIHGLISELIDLVKPQFDAKGLSLEAEYSPDLPPRFVTDLAKLRQILKNFLSNALKFTHEGGVTIQISERGGGYSCPLLFAVSDTGIGIPAEKHEVIFDAFKQADGSTNRLYGGTGLGLSISRELAHLLGGYIELHSNEGEGATFTLCLPLETDRAKLDNQMDSGGGQPVQAEADPDLLKPKEKESTQQTAELDPDFFGKRVLVVDDDLRNLLSLTPVLEGWGLEVTAAGDGKEALETLAEDADFSFVLMDIMMPEMDGYDTITTIRNEAKLQGLVIIAISAKTSGDDGSRCLQAGADAFIAKPIDVNCLKDLIKKHLNT
jgi:CheY-like chemotaxis protein